MNNVRRLPSQQRGAVILTAAFAMLFLLGFMGVALDFGHLFVVKTEMQTAMDSCALAAAQELDQTATSVITRATNAGMTAGNLNRVNFQGGASGVVAGDVTFSDTLIGAYDRDPARFATLKYARCRHTRAGIAPWMLQAMQAFSGDAAYGAPRGVMATGVATRTSAQTNCALPVGLCQKPGGYQNGEWILGSVNSSEQVTGQFRWLDFTGNGGGARELKDVLKGEGQCNLPGNNTIVGKPGNNGSAADAYNTRFGIYQGSRAPPDDGVPDLTGYAWYNDTAIAQPPYPNKYPAFVTKRAAFAPYEGDNQSPDTLGLSTVGRVYSGSLSTVGTDRRIVPLPVVDCAAFDGLSGSGTLQIQSLACVLLLHPIKKGAGPNSTKMWIEYVGAANAPGSPCTTLGLAGGVGGPLVPVLVQ
jgi:hypothetical protein